MTLANELRLRAVMREMLDLMLAWVRTGFGSWNIAAEGYALVRGVPVPGSARSRGSGRASLPPADECARMQGICDQFLALLIEIAETDDAEFSLREAEWADGSLVEVWARIDAREALARHYAKGAA
jgi:hypothetical protein